jgi:uncharacterized protein
MNNPLVWNLMIKKLPSFLQEIEKYLKELNLLEKAKLLESDHLALRFKNIDDVKKIEKELSEKNKIISSAIVNGRKILIFELVNPFKFNDWQINCIELPYPKENQDYPDGWEHIEFVVPSKSESLESFKNDFEKYFFELNIEKLIENGQYSESFPVKESESKELPNPTISLQKRLGLAIKFHPKSIKEIVGY